MSLEESLKQHFKEDEINFKKIDKFNEMQKKDHEEFRASLQEIKDFMKEMQGIFDLVKGVRLLRAPSLWVLGLIIGITALFGGLKSLLAFFISPK